MTSKLTSRSPTICNLPMLNLYELNKNPSFGFRYRIEYIKVYKLIKLHKLIKANLPKTVKPFETAEMHFDVRSAFYNESVKLKYECTSWHI